MTYIQSMHAKVRAHYKALGYEVRITRDGHVTYRKDNGEWREGRFVSEYREIEGQIVLS
jgi:hypothetical protein